MGVNDLLHPHNTSNTRGEDALLKAIGAGDEKAIIKIATTALQSCRRLRENAHSLQKEISNDREAMLATRTELQETQQTLRDTKKKYNAYEWALHEVLNRAVVYKMPLTILNSTVLGSLPPRLLKRVKAIFTKTEKSETREEKRKVHTSSCDLVYDILTKKKATKKKATKKKVAKKHKRDADFKPKNKD